jgi:hypothetical protein
VAYYVSTRNPVLIRSFASNSNPIADYPAAINMGEAQLGEESVARLTMANLGGGELLVDGIESNCSCAGLEMERDGRFYRFESLRLKPSETVNLAIRTSVRGVRVDEELVSQVKFRTNDPERAEGRNQSVVRRVSGGVTIAPSSLKLGNIQQGEEVRHVVDIRDTALTPRTIERLTNSIPDRVTARLLPATDLPVDDVPIQDGRLIARMEICINTKEPGDIRDAVQIHLCGEARNPDELEVRGRVVLPIEVKPPLLVLPRNSPEGPVFSANCVVLSTQGKPLTLTVGSVPTGLSVRLLPGSEGGTRVIQVTLDSQLDGISNNQRFRVPLRAKAGENEKDLEIEILVQR